MVIESVNGFSSFTDFEPLETYSKKESRAFKKSKGIIPKEFWKNLTLKDGTKVKARPNIIKSNYQFNEVLAYDTETYMGKCKLIACNVKSHKPILNPTFEQAIEYLFYKAGYSGIYRFFYNLDFDVSAILKLLDDNKYLEQIDDLSKGIETTFYFKNRIFSFTWLKSRLFIIKDITQRKRVVFTDIFNFFNTSLNKASQTYLNVNGKDDIDGNQLNTSLDYWNANYNAIKEYCIKDCILTAELGKVLIENIIEHGLDLPKFLASSASLSKQYFRKRCFISSITHIPRRVFKTAYDCYYGGRFEILKKGYFPYLELNDINSQYPSFIRDLPSLKYGSWYRSLHIPKKPCLAYYLVSVDIPADYKLPTIPIHHNGINKFPSGVMKVWLTWYDVDLIRDYLIKQNDNSVIVHDGMRFYESKRGKFSKDHVRYPFRNAIDILYSQKNSLKGKSELGYRLTKLTMNALYGCFIERHETIDDNGNLVISAGVLFNPVYASQITAFGRWSVIKDIPKDKYHNVIAIHTDSIISNCKFSEFLKQGNELGSWSKEAEGSGIVINTGMYQIDSIVKTRGIPKRFIGSWFDFLEKNKIYKLKRFEIPHMRKIRECIVRDNSLENVNTIMNAKRSVNPNSDTKRDWFNEFANFQEVLTKQIDSLPYYFWDLESPLEPNPKAVAYRYDSTHF